VIETLFHVMLGSQHLVVWSMDREGNYAVYAQGRDPEAAWPRYGRHRPFLRQWMADRVGRSLSSPYSDTDVHPGSAQYPRVLALNLTHDPALDYWAYVTPEDIRVTVSQLARAQGVENVGAVKERVQELGLRVRRTSRGDAVPMSEVQRHFGFSVGNHIVLYSGQVADFLGVRAESVPDIVRRLGIHVPGRRQVGVRWGHLRRVRRTGPRSFEVRDE
jgi:hypothetical protein